MKPFILAFTLLITASRCGGGSAAPSDAAASQDTGTTPDGAGTGGDVAASDAASETPSGDAPFAAVTALLTQRAAAAGVANIGLMVWNAGDQLVFDRMLGTFTPDTRVAIASASKLVSGLVIFDVIRRGQLTLQSTTGQVLGWTGPNADITLRHLLSFTSGLPREATCTINPLTTLAACAKTLETATALAAAGQRFDYGSTHLLIAAAMAEQVTGQPWASLFAQTLRTPLALPDDVAYYTLPRRATGLGNPLIAGGLRASMNDYRHFLSIAFHKGTTGTLTIGTPAMFDEQAKEPFPAVTIGNTPWPDYRYGLASWLLCATPATGCEVLASPGAFGFTPWYDRASGYYAILGMEVDATGSDEGVVEFAVKLQQDLHPLIAAALVP